MLPGAGQTAGREAPAEERGQRDGSGARAARLGSGRKRGRRSTPGTARPGLPHAPVTRHPPAAHVRSPCPPRPSEGHGEALRARTRAGPRPASPSRAPYAHPAPALPTELGAGAAAGSRPRRSFPDAPMVATVLSSCVYMDVDLSDKSAPVSETAGLHAAGWVITT